MSSFMHYPGFGNLFVSRNVQRCCLSVLTCSSISFFSKNMCFLSYEKVPVISNIGFIKLFKMLKMDSMVTIYFCFFLNCSAGNNVQKRIQTPLWGPLPDIWSRPGLDKHILGDKRTEITVVKACDLGFERRRFDSWLCLNTARKADSWAPLAYWCFLGNDYWYWIFHI